MDAPRKLSPEHENPVDNIIYSHIVEPLTPLLRKHMPWLTPNHITYASIACGVIGIYCFIQQSYIVSALFILASMIIDSFDGYYARKYNMTSKYGDYLDHISDWFLLLAIMICFALTSSRFKYFRIAVFLASSLTMAKQFRCQENMINGTSETINFATQMFTCDDPQKTIKVTRYFGYGTHAIITCLLIASYTFV